MWTQREKGQQTALSRLRQTVYRILKSQGVPEESYLQTVLKLAWDDELAPALRQLGRDPARQVDLKAAAVNAFHRFLDRLEAADLLVSPFPALASPDWKRGHKHRYLRSECVVFCRTRELWGDFSNMNGDYPLLVNGFCIGSSEALYQALRYPHLPHVQQQILAERSPRAAKMRAKSYRSAERPDWGAIKVRVMRFCLEVKLAQHFDHLDTLLSKTRYQPIVEESYRDTFWGCRVGPAETLYGRNELGRLWMELRQQLCGASRQRRRGAAPPTLSEFLLLGEPVREI